MAKFTLDGLRAIFSSLAIKKVTKTDISKDAYLVTLAQQKVLAKAGFRPGIYPMTAVVPLVILDTGEVVEASYYASQRAGSGRPPECRMGRFLHKVTLGDKIAFSTDGLDVFLCLLSSRGLDRENAQKAYEEAAVSANEQLPLKVLISRAKRSRRKPIIQQTTSATYSRDSSIIAFVHRRSEYKCEMPGCDYVGFRKTNGGQYIETHHITPLAVGGDDSIDNAAALCPTCHRIMHYAHDKLKRTAILRSVVKKANKRIGA
jgi:5-methylcytosine-specific restriction endonuclease McrA